MPGPGRSEPLNPAANPRRSLPLGVLLLLGPLLAAAEDPKVTIEGGARPGNTQYYNWKVTNHYSSPIVYIHFPQYHGDTFTAPPNWLQEWENRMMYGGTDAPGWVRTSVDDPRNGIQAGRSASFEMRIARIGALVRPGQVTVRFADGTEAVVADVELPSAPGFIEQHVMGLGLGAIFIIALAVHFHRRRKGSTTSAPMASPTSEGQ